MSDQLPRSAAEISPEWLTTMLRTNGHLASSASVTEVVADPVAAGIGFMGEVNKINVTYEGGEGPATVVAKFPTQNQDVRAMLAPARVFEREARFYDEVAASLGGLTPACYGAGIDVEGDDYVLLLEDLSAYEEGDQLAGASPDQAAQALEALAGLHGHFWGGAGLADLEWMPDCNSEGMKIGREVYAASLPGFLDAFGDSIDAANMDLVERFGASTPDLLDRMHAMPTTIAHFDYRLDNLFFGGPRGVTMIDFQASSRGGFAFDIGYFISQNLSIADRQAHEGDLLATYHAALTAAGASNYSLDQLTADYRVGLLYGWIIPVFAVGTLDFTSERAVALWTNVVERMQPALLEHEVADLLTL